MKQPAQFQHNPGIGKGPAGLPFGYHPVCDAELLGQDGLGHSLFLSAGRDELSDFDLIRIGHLLSAFTVTPRKRNEQEPVVDRTGTPCFPGTQPMVGPLFFMVLFSDIALVPAGGFVRNAHDNQ